MNTQQTNTNNQLADAFLNRAETKQAGASTYEVDQTSRNSNLPEQFFGPAAKKLEQKQQELQAKAADARGEKSEPTIVVNTREVEVQEQIANIRKEIAVMSDKYTDVNKGYVAPTLQPIVAENDTVGHLRFLEKLRAKLISLINFSDSLAQLAEEKRQKAKSLNSGPTTRKIHDSQHPEQRSNSPVS